MHSNGPYESRDRLNDLIVDIALMKDGEDAYDLVDNFSVYSKNQNYWLLKTRSLIQL